MYTILLSTLLLCGSASPAVAASTLPASPTARSEAAALAAALDTVDPDHLEADIHFIASDELAGRDTPSAGLRVAARFLRSRLQRLEWEPGAEDGYFHTYPLDENKLDEEASHLSLQRDENELLLVAGKDYLLRSLLDLGDLDVEGEVVYVGSGTEEEFGSVELEGRWAMCTEGEEHPRVMRNRARTAGAVGLLMAEAEDAEPFEDRSGGVWASLTRGRARFPGKERREREVYPLVLLTRSGFGRLVDFAQLGEPRLPGVRIDPGTALGVRAREVRRRAEPLMVENVCGYWPGSDPELAREVILISAHYDHIGASDGEIYNGADDNGSGTCGLLALAEALVQYGPMRRSVMLVWVSGEEKGLWGSRAWVTSGGWLPETEHGPSRAIANINIDMIGRNAPDELLVTPTEKRPSDYNGIVRRIEELAPEEGFTKLGSADPYYHRSDQAEFAKLGIPVTFLFADVHEDYHRPGDTADKLDYDKIRRVVRLVLRTLDAMQEDELDL